MAVSLATLDRSPQVPEPICGGILQSPVTLIVHQKPLTRRPVHLVAAWLTGLCVLIQSLGLSVGGVLCIGCGDPGVGLTLVAEHCGPLDECCDESRSSPGEPGDGQANDCWCFDVPVSGDLGATPSLQPGLKLAAAHWALPSALARLETFVACAPITGASRDGPPIVRQLVPSSRQTTLLL